MVSGLTDSLHGLEKLEFKRLSIRFGQTEVAGDLAIDIEDAFVKTVSARAQITLLLGAME